MLHAVSSFVLLCIAISGLKMANLISHSASRLGIQMTVSALTAGSRGAVHTGLRTKPALSTAPGTTGKGMYRKLINTFTAAACHITQWSNEMPA